MCGNYPAPPQMILTPVPEVGADRQDSATESSDRRVVVDVPVSRRQETGALGAGELALSGTHAHKAVRSVFMCKLQGRAGPVFEDVSASVEEVRFAFRGMPPLAVHVRFVENGDGSAPTSYGPVARDRVDVRTFDGPGDVICSDVQGGGIWRSGG